MKFLGWLFDAMLWADSALMLVLERFCHKLQRLFGVTNFWVYGMVCFICALIGTLNVVSAPFAPTAVEGYLTWYQHLGIMDWSSAKPVSTILYALLVFNVVLFLWCGLGWRKEEARAFERLKHGVANPKRQPMPALIPFVFLNVMLFVMLGAVERVNIMSLLIPLWWYLDRLDPLPPSTSKVRQWIESLLMKPIPVQS